MTNPQQGPADDAAASDTPTDPAAPDTAPDTPEATAAPDSTSHRARHAAIDPDADGAHVAATSPDAPRRRGTTRRWFLAGSGVVVLAAGAGIATGFAHHEPRPRRRRPPQELVAAVATERTLLADIDATTGGDAGLRRILSQARADHAAHLHALEGLVAQYPSPPAGTSGAASPSAAGRARTAGQLRAAEQGAARLARGRASTSDGPTATLLASIAACEAVHADLLADV